MEAIIWRPILEAASLGTTSPRLFVWPAGAENATTFARFYVPADPEEDDDEDPEEDPINYPADGGDDGDDEMDIEEDKDADLDINADEEDEDDEMDVEIDEEAEEEHSAPAYPVVCCLGPATATPAEED
ncbi:hypothetical protein Tco_0219004 [Tanacetum coccineum]